MATKNFKITALEDNKEYWISRACAVVVFVIGEDKEKVNPKLLVSKRGPGCPDHIGKWAFTCGYLDWDESLEQAAQRELYEELGLLLPIESFKIFSIQSDPKQDARQNVTIRFRVTLKEEELQKMLDTGEINKHSWSRGGESGEVDDIKLIPLSEVDNYEWAFNHRQLIDRLFNCSDWKPLKPSYM